MVMTMTDIQLFQILKQKLGEKEAEALVSFEDAKLKENNEQNLNVVATKQDVTNIKEDISKVEIKLAETKSEIIKWMFIFWVGQLASFIAIAKFVFHQ
jgi:hypothetical protein